MKRLSVFFLFLLVFFTALPLLAQDTVYVPITATINGKPVTAALIQDVPAEPPVLDVPTFEEVRDTFVLALLTLLSGLLTSPVTSAIVAFVKRLPPLKNTSAAAINVVVAVVLMGGSWAAAYFGFKVQFDKLLELILAIAPILIGVEVNAAGSRSWYHSALVKELPFFGTSRSAA